MTNLAIKLDDKVPAHIKLDGIGRGNENVGQNIIVPRIKLLQKMSNEVDKHHKEHIAGAEVGDFINTLTKQVMSEIYCLSLTFKVEWAVWRNMEVGAVTVAALTTSKQPKSVFPPKRFPKSGTSKRTTRTCC